MNTNLALVACLHGNEKYGLKVCKSFSNIFSFFIGNPRALKAGKRFMESDMNRIFPGSFSGNYEERLAFALKEKLQKFEYVLDFHSTSNECPLFGIITKPTKKKIEFAKKLGLSRLVVMSEEVAANGALIDHVSCGISLEIGPNEGIENVQEVSKLIRNFLYGRNREPLEVFEIFEIIKKGRLHTSVSNFVKVEKGDILSVDLDGSVQIAKSSFYPVLVSESSYGETLCLAARKVSQF